MSATTKYANILGLDFTCKSDNPDDELKCPMFVGSGPETDPYTGVITCPLCGTLLGTEAPTGEELYDDDPDDEEYVGSKGDYVAEGPVKVDATPKEKREHRLFKAIRGMLPIIQAHDNELAIDIDEKQYEIIEMLYKLEESKVPDFVETRSNNLKLLAIALYLTDSELPSKVYIELRQKAAKVAQLVDILKQLESPHEDNQLEKDFTMIGRAVNIPDSISNDAYETYLEEKPYSSIDNMKVTISAWLYHYCQRVEFRIGMKDFYENIRGVSRNSLSKVVNTFDEQLRNSKIQTEVLDESG